MADERNKFDITEVSRRLRERGYGVEQVDLFNHLRRQCINNPQWKLLLASIMQACADENKNAVDSMGAALLYGMQMGVLMERERLERKLKISVV